MNNSFYNTTNETGQVLKRNISKAGIQDDLILDFFKKNPDNEFTPLEVWQARFDESTPITSIRRSITNLTKSGKLEETDIKRMGAHGGSNYCWKLFVPQAPKEFYQENCFEMDSKKDIAMIGENRQGKSIQAIANYAKNRIDKDADDGFTVAYILSIDLESKHTKPNGEIWIDVSTVHNKYLDKEIIIKALTDKIKDLKNS